MIIFLSVLIFGAVDFIFGVVGLIFGAVVAVFFVGWCKFLVKLTNNFLCKLFKK